MIITPQDKANELYGRYLNGYLKVTDVTTARINSRDCVHAVCNSMINEIIAFGKVDSDNILYNISFWVEVKNEVNSIPI